MATPLLSPVPAYGFALNGFGHYADEEAKRGSDQALPPFELAPILEPALPASSTANVRCTEAYGKEANELNGRYPCGSYHAESHLYVGNSEGHVLWYTLANEGTSTQVSTVFAPKVWWTLVLIRLIIPFASADHSVPTKYKHTDRIGFQTG
ncbi:hypothetical protein OC846_003301 [Tilletia horrida]|uniref:Uncharacterized protein n=1 Tax=Tilletia horrida TaxID=155126 RepID=A0AAN6GQQ0_9BASI|nr:hypothetical protein OC846_003301 [Tilletia horrida]